MISRVANRRRGMNELDIMQLIQAFVISLIIYSFFYLRVLKAGEHKIDRVIRVTQKGSEPSPVDPHGTSASNGASQYRIRTMHITRIKSCASPSLKRGGKHYQNLASKPPLRKGANNVSHMNEGRTSSSNHFHTTCILSYPNIDVGHGQK